MKFKFPEQSYVFAEKQITQLMRDLDFYETISQSEYNSISQVIDKPKTILDMGCGLGRMSVYMNSIMKDESIHYILADSTQEIPEKMRYGWNPSGGFYNDLKLTSDFCKLNGLSNFETFDLKNNDLTKLTSVDLIMSFLCVGFHYPIDMYMDKFKQIISPRGVMIFGVRKQKYDKSIFESQFGKVTIVEQPNIDTREDILILENMI